MNADNDIVASSSFTTTVSEKQMARRKRSQKEGPVRLQSLDVTDFKALDHLELDLPPPRMASEPDVFVLGSRNGLGKTSVLEACALLLLAARVEEGLRKELLRFPRRPDRRYDRPLDLADLFVRSGAERSTISAELNVGNKGVVVTITASRTGWLSMKPEDPIPRLPIMDRSGPWEIEQLVDSLASFSPEPLVLPPLLYFHSYRKVAEGAPEFGTWVEGGPVRIKRWRRPGEGTMSAFKMELLGLLMRRADLFESEENGREESVQALDQLNSIIEKYAGGRIDKLLPAPDNTIDFRISPTKGGRSFSFDGLSSGQKEVISTLFLTWRYTRTTPGILLIDEPELHLNPEWQRDFIRQLYTITPESQIIIATHSEDIFGSVSEDRRILLGE